MGVKMAQPDDDVFCITGEGSIQMCIQELSTCKQYNTPVKIISLNNRYLGMVRQWQQIEYKKPLFAVQLHGRAARLREAGRGLRSRRHA
jgi:thiamine pyrophosphate-dependent acetolactate synthase large subunit-like protein